MEGNMLMFLLVLSSVGLALSNPLVNPNYDNIHQCLQPPASGLCLAYIPSYYYNPSKETCDTFIYGGCQGNANRFFSFDECMAKCGGFKQESNESFKLILDEEQSSSDSEQQVEDICSLSSEMGPCRAMMPRFYFNGDKCENFIYGGCQGNGNNFKTVEECQQKCGSTSSSSQEVEADNNEETEKASDEAGSQEASVESAEDSDSKTEN